MSISAANSRDSREMITLYDSRGRVLQQTGPPGQRTMAVYDVNDPTAVEGSDHPKAGVDDTCNGERGE